MTGVQTCALPIWIAFDTKEAYPKFVFSAIRPLTDAEADQVLALRNDPRVTRILAEIGEGSTSTMLAVTQQSVFEQPPHDPDTGEIKSSAPAPAPAPAPAAKREYKKKAAAPAPAPTPAAEPEAAPSGTSFDDEFDAMLENLLPS